MHQSQPPPPYQQQQPPYQQPPLPADDRIKKAVRAGQVFNDPYDAARAVAYAEGFLKNGRDVMQPAVLLAIAFGLLVTVALQIAVGYVFMLVIPVGLFLGVVGYLAWFSANRPRVEQALEANRRVAGG
jgi:hypothetical protein